MTTPLLQIQQLNNYYGKQQVLRDVSFELFAGEILGLAGGSGSGKSTLARCIAGLIPFSSGNIVLAAQVLSAKRSAAQFKQQASLLQMVFQDPYTSVNPRWCISDILTEPLALPREQKTKLAAEWLDKVSLPQSMLSRYPTELSGGQLQRINIARALINQPKLLICDESLAALDVSTQAQIANLLKDLRDKLGTSLLFIGHDLSMMNFLCDRIAVMHQGEIVDIGSSHSVLSKPNNVYSKRLIGNAQRKAQLFDTK